MIEVILDCMHGTLGLSNVDGPYFLEPLTLPGNAGVTNNAEGYVMRHETELGLKACAIG